METVKFVSENGISKILLNRPETFNALNPELMQDLLTVINEIEKNDDKIVIISGAGRAYCAGGDINMMLTDEVDGLVTPRVNFDDLMALLKKLTLKLYLMPKIVISAVHGSAAGLGLSLALNSDYIVTTREARFGMLFAGIGLVPDGGGHFFLKDRLGTHQAKQFIWSLEQINGEKAKEIGMADILVEEDVIKGAENLATELTHKAIKAIIETKMLLHNENKAQLERILDNETVSQLKMRKTVDHAEGVRAFLAKEQAKFTGQ